MLGANEPVMSVREIIADFEAMGRAQEHLKAGSCGSAAFEAKVFFDEAHTIMRCKVVRAVLYAPSGLVLADTGEAPARDPGAVVSTDMKPHVLRGGCVWVVDDENTVDLEPDANITGHKHYVALVDTHEGESVAVDWSIGQFRDVPHDTRLFF